MTQRHYIQHGRAMHVTTNTFGREPIFADPALAREAIDCLYRVQSMRPFFLYGFVIMPDHCHFLLQVPEPGSISAIMNAYKPIVRLSIGLPKAWQRRFFLTYPHNPWATLRYIHANPVRARLVDVPEGYPWSSASGKWDVSPIQEE